MDSLSQFLATRFLTAHAPHLLDPGADTAPLCLHWCLSPVLRAPSELGDDGHPRVGNFLPPVPLPRRMWASGQLVFHADLPLDRPLERTSQIRTITAKSGATGALWFVTLDHQIREPAGPLLLQEEQVIVYRAANAATARAMPADIGPEHECAQIEFDEVSLFRYSAMTFNGHRIHYDRPYACSVEGYDGLVVHGPLQATLLAHAASKILGKLKSFSFRGIAPLIAPCRASLRARADGDGLGLCICNPDGGVTMRAIAR